MNPTLTLPLPRLGEGFYEFISPSKVCVPECQLPLPIKGED
jgi:hypothetical protein